MTDIVGVLCKFLFAVPFGYFNVTSSSVPGYLWKIFYGVFIFYFSLHCVTYGIFVPPPGVESEHACPPPFLPPQRKQSLNHWTNREVPVKLSVAIHLGLKWSHLLQRDLRFPSARLLGSLWVRYRCRPSSVLKVPLLTHAVRTWPVFTCLFLVETSTTSSMGYFRTFGGHYTASLLWGLGSMVVVHMGLASLWLVGPSSPWPVIQTSPLAVRAQSPNHWTAGEFSYLHLFWKQFSLMTYI